MNKLIEKLTVGINNIKRRINPYTKIKSIEELNQIHSLDLHDLSALDLREYLHLFINIDNKHKVIQWTERVIWPTPDKLPDDFNPKKILDTTMSPRNMTQIKEAGIDGKGINIAIIDDKLFLENPEYKDNLKYYSQQTESNIGPAMHGALVCCRAVGKNTGTAPGANLYYFEAEVLAGRTKDFFERNIKALERVLQYNKNAKPENKIHILSCSWALYSTSNGEKATVEQRIRTYTLIQELYNMGIKIIHCDPGPLTTEDTEQREQIEQKLHNNGFANVHWCDEIFFPDDENMEQHKRFSQYPGIIGIPTLNMSHIDYHGVKRFNGYGGDSSAAPYLAGVYACALQNNQIFMTRQNWQEELDTILQETATPTKNGGKMINPMGIRERVSEIAREMEMNLIKQNGIQHE